VSLLAISREEAHMEARFGEEWRAYAARVRRWL
jgi:protein-S-isoprenylcysteine O-methyltransferase Ste14